jgi:hypothetical protein
MLDAYRELIDLLAETPRHLKGLVEGRELPAQRSNEDWGPIEVIAHMVDAERLSRERIVRMLAEETPYFRAMNQLELARAGDYASRSLHEVLESFGHERGETLSVLMNLAPKDWERTAIHETQDEITVEDIIEDLIEHDREHLDQIRRLLGA